MKQIKMIQKIIAAILVLMLCFSMLTGCGSDKENSGAADPGQADPETPALSSAGNAADDATGMAAGYTAKYLQLTDLPLTAALENGVAAGDAVYYTSLGVISDETPEGVIPEWEEQYWVYGPMLCKVGTDGSMQKIPYTPSLPETETAGNSGTIFSSLYVSPKGQLWIAEKQFHNWYDAPEGMTESDPAFEDYFRSEESSRLVCVEENGTVVSEISLEGLKTHAEEIREADGSYSFDVIGIAEDSDGRLCVAVQEWYYGRNNYIQDNRICVLDETTGNLLDTVPMSSTPEYLVGLPDGNIAVCYFQAGSDQISLLDLSTKSFEDTVAIDDFVNGMIAGGGEYPVYYSAGDSLYGLDFSTGESVKLLNWIDSDVAREGDESICVLADGRIVTTASSKTANGIENDLVVLTKAEAGQAAQKKVLKMAVMNLYPFTSKMVSRFNRNNSEYRIEVTDYSQFNDYSSGNEEDWNAGITRLQTEIIAGEVPDILDISLLSAYRLGTKGILEDLYPYLEADPELNLTDLNEHVLQAFEENGHLYQTVGNFYVLTTAGLSNVVGDQIGWNMDEFNAAMQMLQAENPNSTVFGAYMTKDTALTFLLYLELENYVDWNNGECRFDSDGFIRLLQFVKSFPTTFDWTSDLNTNDLDEDTRLLMGLQLLKQCNFVCFEDYQINTIGLNGAPCTFVGYPTENGVGSMFAQIGNSFAITSSCADKEAAWEFVRQIFLPEYQEQFMDSVFPTNLSVYEEMKNNAMTPKYQRNPDGSYMLNSDGERIEEDRGNTEVNGVTYQYKTVSEEEISKIEEIVQATDSILHVDNSLKSIIVEGAEPYFADQRSVEEVAKLIQSKAMLYVNEQR